MATGLGLGLWTGLGLGLVIAFMQCGAKTEQTGHVYHTSTELTQQKLVRRCIGKLTL